jgi:hypothetical protein
MKRLSMVSTIIGASLLCAAPISLHWSPTKQLGVSLDAAQARIGRPLTPFSVAGVHRRMYRRAYTAVTSAIIIRTPTATIVPTTPMPIIIRTVPTAIIHITEI